MASQLESGGRSDGGKEGIGNGGWIWILAFVGLSMLAAGGYLALATRIGTGAAWTAQRLAEAGVSSGALLVGGVITMGLALVCAGQSRLVRGAHSLPRISRELGELRKGQKRLADRFGTLHLEMSVLQEANKTLLRAAQDQSAVQSAGMQVDATFRLAASMDQLGARLEGRLEDQRSKLENRLGDLVGSVQETREHVAQWLQLHCDETSQGKRESLDESSEDALVLEESDEPSLTLESAGSWNDYPEWDPDAPAELPDFDDFDELEVLVTLDEEFDDEDDEDDTPLLDLTPWDELNLDDEEEQTLEAAVRFEVEQATEVETEEEEPSELAGDDDFDLGLLDVLDEDGTLIDGREAPEAADSMPTPPPIGVKGDARETSGETRRAPEPPSILRQELTDEVLKEALDTVKRRRGL